MSCVALAHDALLHAADADHWHVALEGGADAGGEIGDARRFGGCDHRGRVARPREAVGHEGGALFVAGQDEADLRRRAQFVEDGEVLRAGDAEDMIDAFAQQAIDQRAGAGDGFDGLVPGGLHGETFLCAATLTERQFYRAAGNKKPRAAGFLPGAARYAAFCSARNCLAMKAMTMACERSAAGLGTAVHSCSQPSKISSWHSPPAAR